MDRTNVRLDHGADDTADFILPETFGQRIDGQNFVAVFLLGAFDHLDPWMGHLPSPPAKRRFARKEQFLAHFVLVVNVRLVVPDGSQVIVTLSQQQTRAGASWAGRLEVDFLDGAPNAQEFVFYQFPDESLVGKILIIAWEEK